MSIAWLRADTRWFPPSSRALQDPNGLLAAGGDLSPTRLLNAYQRGIFPWYSDDQPILWWSPSPRAVFFPGQIHLARSLKKHLRHCNWHLRIDTAFDQVTKACAAPRDYAAGTWLNPAMQDAYGELHRLGYAHSLEVWSQDQLVGGLYGISLGRVFFGESMFSRATNASKVALAGLSQQLATAGFAVIDCQVGNPHLFSLGAQLLARPAFEAVLQQHAQGEAIAANQPLWHQWAKQQISCDQII
jgi:leucyl/phenylalanyl-tRNA---protein transferase